MNNYPAWMSEPYLNSLRMGRQETESQQAARKRSESDTAASKEADDETKFAAAITAQKVADAMIGEVTKLMKAANYDRNLELGVLYDPAGLPKTSLFVDTNGVLRAQNINMAPAQPRYAAIWDPRRQTGRAPVFLLECGASYDFDDIRLVVDARTFKYATQSKPENHCTDCASGVPRISPFTAGSEVHDNLLSRALMRACFAAGLID